MNMNRKELFVLVIAFMGMVMAGCDQPEPPVVGAPPVVETPVVEPPVVETPVVVPAPEYPKKFWGEWVSSTNGIKFYITSNQIARSDRTSTYDTSATIEQISDHVIRLLTPNEGSYYLFSNRTASGSFTGNVVNLESDQLRSLSPSRSISGVGGIQLVLTNLNDAAQTSTVIANEDGTFTTQDTIPNDPYQVSVEGRSPIEVTAPDDGGDIGTITVTNGLNFKISASNGNGSSLTELYVNQSYSISLNIANVGTNTAQAATYTVSLDDGLVLNSGKLTGILGSIAPGKKISISLNLTCSSLEGEEEFKKIYVEIHDPLNNKTWRDSASIHFYKESFYVTVRTSGVGKGIINNSIAIITPRNGTYINNTTIPRIGGDYIIAIFNGYGAECIYELNPNDGYSSYSSYSSFEEKASTFLDTANYEPNNTEDSAQIITGPIMSYLHKGDVDYYKFHIE